MADVGSQGHAHPTVLMPEASRAETSLSLTSEPKGLICEARIRTGSLREAGVGGGGLKTPMFTHTHKGNVNQIANTAQSLKKCHDASEGGRLPQIDTPLK